MKSKWLWAVLLAVLGTAVDAVNVMATASSGLPALVSPAPAVTLPPGNAAQQWNKIAEDTVVGSGAFQGEGFVYMAYVSMAMAQPH